MAVAGGWSWEFRCRDLSARDPERNQGLCKTELLLVCVWTHPLVNSAGNQVLKVGTPFKQKQYKIDNKSLDNTKTAK